MAQHEDIEDRQTLKAAKDYARREQLQLADAVTMLLKVPHGRRYLYWLLEIGKAIGENPFTGTAEGTIFNCGEQNVGQRIMSHILEVDPAGFTSLLQERAEERMALKSETQEDD